MNIDKKPCDFKIFGVLGDLSRRKFILEVMRGNQALFIHRDEVERSWTWIDSIQDAWARCNELPKSYPAGSWGPVASVALLARDGREWEE